MTADYLSLLLEHADAGLRAAVEQAATRAYERETRRRPFFPGQGAPPRPAPAESPQVTELLKVTQGSDGASVGISLQELCDLQERRGSMAKARRVLDDAAERRRKYEIETGIMRDGTIRRPLETWSCPGSSLASMALYFRITSSEPGTVWLGELDEQQLTAVKWMRDQQLVAVGDADEILPLSDARPPAQRIYPGAPVDDREVRLRYSAYLRGFGRGLVLAAIANLSAGRSVRRSKQLKRRETLVADGLAITAADVCGEANRIKASRDDLAVFRYMSLSTCRQLIKELIGDGVLDELKPPTAVRRSRSWRTLPRVIRRLAAAVGFTHPLTDPPEEP